jgi:hypothetical protein
MKLYAEFTMGKLIQLSASDLIYLRKFFRLNTSTSKTNKDLLKIIMANKNYPGLLPKRSSGSRLKLLLKSIPCKIKDRPKIVISD